MKLFAIFMMGMISTLAILNLVLADYSPWIYWPIMPIPGISIFLCGTYGRLWR